MSYIDDKIWMCTRCKEVYYYCCALPDFIDGKRICEKCMGELQ